MHRVFVFFTVHNADADDAGDEIDGLHNQWEENALDSEDRIERCAEDHGADVFPLPSIQRYPRHGQRSRPRCRPTRSAITAGLRGSSSGNSGFDLADQVSANVSGLGVKCRRRAGQRRATSDAPKAEADQLERGLLRVTQSSEGKEEDADSQQGERHHDEPRHKRRRAARSAAPCPGLSARPMLCGYSIGWRPHACLPGKSRTCGSDQEADDDFIRIGSSKRRETIAPNKE